MPLFLIWRDIANLDHGLIRGSTYWGRDFTILWTGGQLIHEGAVSAMYNLAAFQSKIASLFGPLEPMGYPYPPVTFPIAFLFGLLPYWLAQLLWFAGTGALFIYACRPFWSSAMGPRWLALVTPAALMNIWAGHYGFLHGALFLLGWSHLERRPKAAGFFFGCMLIKPHLAVLIPLALALRKSWTAIASAAVTVIGLIALSSILYGWEAWRDYLANMVAPQVALIGKSGGLLAFMSTSTTQAVLRMTGNHGLAIAAQAAVAAASLGALIAAARRNPPVVDFALLTATFTFLVLPYAFNYDLTVVMVGALAIVWRADLPLRLRLLGAIGFAAPGIGMLLSGDGIAIMPLMLAALAFAQFQALPPRRAVQPSIGAVPAAA